MRSDFAPAAHVGSGSNDVSLERFEPKHIRLLGSWLARSHVARWFGEPDAHVAWARKPPAGASQALIAIGAKPVGYLRWQRVSRTTLDSVGLVDIPENSVDVDLFIGQRGCLGRGVGPKVLELLLASLRADATIPLAAVSTSIENVAARRAFEKAGFRILREYTAPGFGACWLLVVPLRQTPDAQPGRLDATRDSSIDPKSAVR